MKKWLVLLFKTCNGRNYCDNYALVHILDTLVIKDDVYPVDLSIGLLDRVMASSEPKTILADIKTIKGYLPAEGNPVYLFPTDTTNFVRIQADLDVMLASTEKISAVPRDSSAFHYWNDGSKSKSRNYFRKILWI